MKYLLTISFSFFLVSVSSQIEQDSAYSVTYLSTFKKKLSSDYIRKEYVRLMVDGDKSIYQIYKVMKLDTLKHKGIATENDIVNLYSSHNQHTLVFNKNKLKFYDSIYEDLYTYDEIIEHNWTIGKEQKTINGYNCKIATMSYGGRKWNAWFTLDIPINAGPYKFKGLPGLIVEIADDSGSYNFNFYSIIKKPMGKYKKYYSEKPLEDYIKTNRNDFNKIKANFESLSLNEKLNYGNTGPKIEVVNVNGESLGEMRNPKKTARAKDLNLIEIDYKKK